jgi:hypothetical protein
MSMQGEASEGPAEAREANEEKEQEVEGQRHTLLLRRRHKHDRAGSGDEQQS